MRNIQVGSSFSQSNGNRYRVTRVLGNNQFLAIWVGNRNFTDMTTYNGFMRYGHFTLDNNLFRQVSNGFRRISRATGVLGLVNGDSSIYDLVNA